MRHVADDVWQVPLAPRESVNAYVIGDVLIDAGTAGMGEKLPETLAGHEIAAHAITHAHRDHVGGSKAVVKALGTPFWAPERDAPAAEAGTPVIKDGPLKPLLSRGGFPPIAVDRRLREGDEVGGFRVLDVPGHSLGHVAYWRESDRVLICGDVWFNFLVSRMGPGLRDPYPFLTLDPEQNRASQRRLAELEPSIVCFGHGPVLREAARTLRAYVSP